MTTPDPDSVVEERWIIDTNLRPLCESVAEFVGYEFDDSDWQAIDTALPTTDVERSVWYDHPFSGQAPVTLEVAADPGSSVVFVRFFDVSDDRTKAQIEAALHIFASWELA
ncbi:hypothetical protein [Kribbella jiaozuonensis]|uniref:Uncharacterized protein n=1 Tax=Kribbella jiaozuonensis TaxID=2575441 RepID=A0A4U3LZV6_9ACTN|nr:hypothetical protein [Kribbella jiaozuonensis]TKK81935.1 hypothetical protein FDA38_03700 [Kribbella jiaozuonensis]